MDYIRLPPSGRMLVLEAFKSDGKSVAFQLKSWTQKFQIQFYVLQFKEKVRMDLSRMF